MIIYHIIFHSIMLCLLQHYHNQTNQYSIFKLVFLKKIPSLFVNKCSNFCNFKIIIQNFCLFANILKTKNNVEINLLTKIVFVSSDANIMHNGDEEYSEYVENLCKFKQNYY